MPSIGRWPTRLWLNPALKWGRSWKRRVFLHWRRQRDDLAYLAGDREVDLVINRDRPEQLINVAYSVSRAQTWDREIASLEWAAGKYPKVPRVLIAHEHSARKPPAGIQLADAWRYLLGSKK